MEAVLQSWAKICRHCLTTLFTVVLGHPKDSGYCGPGEAGEGGDIMLKVLGIVVFWGYAADSGYCIPFGETANRASVLRALSWVLSHLAIWIH